MSNPEKTIAFDVLTHALKLAGEHSWNDLTLRQIADAANVPLSSLYPDMDKQHLAQTLETWADLAMSTERFDPEDTPRERLFDAIMRRFETFETERAGVLSLMKWRDRSGAMKASLVRARAKSANWALCCTGLDTLSPLDMRATGLGLGWVIAQTERAWRADEGGDFARTMATLDAELISAEDRLATLRRFVPGRRDKAKPDANAPDLQTTNETAANAEPTDTP